jgi:hypothetical protein
MSIEIASQLRFWTSRRLQYVTLVSLLAVVSGPVRGELVNQLTIPGESKDLWPGDSPWNNRLGLGSDLHYDVTSGSYFGLADRGPGAGSTSFVVRVQQFTLATDPATGSIGEFNLQRTIPFKSSDGSESFEALTPSLLNGDPHVLGRSLDAEGFVIGPNGMFYLADEYGPSLQEFEPVMVGGQLEARHRRSFVTPDNLLPRDATGEVQYEATRTTDPPQVSGRQSGRGFEGLTITPDGRSLFAILQEPLNEDGDRQDGRRGRNLRIVAFDTESGQSTGQFVYQVESLSDINSRLPANAAFSATQQGRNIGVSSITAIDDHRFLVLERDNRGLDVDNPSLTDPVLSAVGTKRVYQIDLSGATDVSQMALTSNDLPDGVVPVDKRILIDLRAELEHAGLTVPAKTEGLTIGQQLGDGSYSIVVSTDNDFSVVEVVDPAGVNDPEIMNIFSDGTTGVVDGDLAGRSLLPIYLMAFRLPSLIAADGDLDDNGVTDVTDVNQLLHALATGGQDDRFDLTRDLKVDVADLKYWTHTLAGTTFGDANLDRTFDSSDLVHVLQEGKYELDVDAGWAQGDWSGDSRFGSDDLVLALADGGYTNGAPLLSSVPEPSSWLLVALGIAGWMGSSRTRWPSR